MFASRTELLSRPIPINPKPISGWKEVPIKASGEPLVPLGPFSEYPSITQDSIYFGERLTSPYLPKGLDNSLLTPFVRRGLAEKLKRAEKLLPEGHLFLAWDSFRPLDVQAALFEYYKHELAQQQPQLLENELMQEAQRFVSLPSTDPTKPSPHNTGGVIDLTIVRLPVPIWRELQAEGKAIYQNQQRGYPHWWDQLVDLEWRKSVILRALGVPLNMGTPFDYVGPETETNYYEQLDKRKGLNPLERTVLLNRRMLFNALKAVGIENYEEEWWHYSHGDQMWGRKTGRLAIYGAATLSQDNLGFEQERLEFYKGMVEETELGYDRHLYEDPRQTQHVLAARI